jgi:hypothetical protein
MTGEITVKNDRLDNADDGNKSNIYSSDSCQYFPKYKNCYNGERHGDIIIGKEEKEKKKNNMTCLIMIRSNDEHVDIELKIDKITKMFMKKFKKKNIVTQNRLNRRRLSVLSQIRIFHDHSKNAEKRYIIFWVFPRRAYRAAATRHPCVLSVGAPSLTLSNKASRSRLRRKSKVR